MEWGTIAYFRDEYKFAMKNKELFTEGELRDIKNKWNRITRECTVAGGNASNERSREVSGHLVLLPSKHEAGAA
jgi:hypothetical protein